MGDCRNDRRRGLSISKGSHLHGPAPDWLPRCHLRIESDPPALPFAAITGRSCAIGALYHFDPVLLTRMPSDRDAETIRWRSPGRDQPFLPCCRGWPAHWSATSPDVSVHEP